MAKLATEKIKIEEFSFSYDVNVNKDGTFTTTLPSDIVTLFSAANVALNHNRMRNKGYFEDSTYDGLVKQVKDTAKEYMSRELVSSKIVISYVIQTRCSYSLDLNGCIVPNATKQWTGKLDSEPSIWHGGTNECSSNHPSAYGLLVYAKPFIRQDYAYQSGKTKMEHKRLSQESEYSRPFLEADTNLRWLDAVVNMIPPPDSTFHELDYTEDVTEFFVGLIKSICMMNEKIKDFVKPEALKLIIENKVKFLS